jgi:hypothetical protein
MFRGQPRAAKNMVKLAEAWRARTAFMKGRYEVEKISFDRVVDPYDQSRLHGSDWNTQRLAEALEVQIVLAVETAQTVKPSLCSR